jgi:hypothetical protein
MVTGSVKEVLWIVNVIIRTVLLMLLKLPISLPASADSCHPSTFDPPSS